MKLKNKLLTYIGLPVIIVLVIIATVSYTSSQKMLKSEINKKMHLTSAFYGTQIESLIEDNKQKLHIMSLSVEDNIIKPNYTNADLASLLTSMTKNSGNLGDVFLGSTDKPFIDGAGWVADGSYDPTKTQWYEDAIGKTDIALSNPYVLASDKTKLVLTISKEVKKNGQPFGVLGADISLDTIKEQLSKVQIGKTGTIVLVTGKGEYIYGKDKTLEQNISEDYPDLAQKLLENPDDKEIENNGMYYFTKKIGGTDWVIIANIAKSEEMAPVHKLSLIILSIAVISLLIVILIIYGVSKSVTHPVEELCTDIENMANYDLTITDSKPSKIYSNRSDEIGDISKSIVQVKQTMQDMMISLNDIASQLSSSSEELTATSEQSSATAGDVARAMEEISKGAMTQAEDVQNGTMAMSTMQDALNTTSSSIDTLSGMTNQVMNAKEKGIEAVNELIDATQNSYKKLAQVHEVITNTNDSAQKIEVASDMIKSISEQTNLLALNAAIEAARAGDAGKGFAVVAEEIRKLAEQSNSFTEEIRQIVDELSGKTSEAVDIMQQVKELVTVQSDKVTDTQIQFKTISQELDSTKDAVVGLNKTQEQLTPSKNEMISIMENLSALSEENAASAEESAASAEKQTSSSEEIARASANLAELAQKMTQMVSKFVL